MSVSRCIDKLVPTRPVVKRRTHWLIRLWRWMTEEKETYHYGSLFSDRVVDQSRENLGLPPMWMRRADKLREERRQELEEMERGPLPPWFKAKDTDVKCPELRRVRR